MSEPAPDTPEQWVLEEVHHRVETAPDGLQNVESNIWTATQRLRDDGRKFSTKYGKEKIEQAVETLQEEDEMLSWHGLLAPATDEHLKAVIENERKAEITRSTLVGRCNALLSVNGGGGGR